MKILCEYTPAGPSYVRSGWGRVFQKAGHDFRFWLPEKTCAFDAFSEFSPDLFIGTTYGVDRAIAKCIAARPEMKVILFASAWGDLIKNVDLKKYPIVAVSDEEKRIIERLKAATGKPDYVFTHISEKYREPTLGGWNEIGVRPVGILNGADTFLYENAKYKQELSCDISICGGYWFYKAKNLDRYILPLCHPSSGLSVKIFGNSQWPVAQYLGCCSDEDNRDLFVSSTVCANVSEPHSTEPSLGFDTIERFFKIAMAKGFCVSDYVPEAAEQIFTNNEVVFASSPDDFREKIHYYVKNPHERQKYIENGYQSVINNHTYFHRVAKMLNELGMKKEADNCLFLLKRDFQKEPQ